MVNVRITTYDGLPCECKEFTINGVDADQMDFGVGNRGNIGRLIDCESVMLEYGCPNRIWLPYNDEEHIQRAMNTYNISEEDYDEVCDILQSTLSVGRCGWCI